MNELSIAYYGMNYTFGEGGGCFWIGSREVTLFLTCVAWKLAGHQ